MRKCLRKYWTIARVGFLNSLVYRVDVFLWGFTELLDTLVFLFIWIVLFGKKQTIGGFTLYQTITYLIGVGVIANICDTRIAYNIQQDIQSGYLSNILLKPVRYSLARGIMTISDKPLGLVIRLTVYTLLALFFKEKFILNQNLGVLILFFFSVILAYLINFLIEFLLGCFAFWTTTTRGAMAVLGTVKAIFSGSYAPLSFFPPLFQTVASILPFASTRYFPMLIYLGKLSRIKIIKGLLIQVFWIGVLMVLTKKIWQKGLREYEGVGI